MHQSVLGKIDRGLVRKIMMIVCRWQSDHAMKAVLILSRFKCIYACTERKYSYILLNLYLNLNLFFILYYTTVAKEKNYLLHMSSTFSSASSPRTYLRARTVNHFRVQQRSGSFSYSMCAFLGTGYSSKTYGDLCVNFTHEITAGFSTKPVSEFLIFKIKRGKN